MKNLFSIASRSSWRVWVHMCLHAEIFITFLCIWWKRRKRVRFSSFLFLPESMQHTKNYIYTHRRHTHFSPHSTHIWFTELHTFSLHYARKKWLYNVHIRSSSARCLRSFDAFSRCSTSALCLVTHNEFAHWELFRSLSLSLLTKERVERMLWYGQYMFDWLNVCLRINFVKKTYADDDDEPPCFHSRFTALNYINNIRNINPIIVLFFVFVLRARSFAVFLLYFNIYILFRHKVCVFRFFLNLLKTKHCKTERKIIIKERVSCFSQSAKNSAPTVLPYLLGCILDKTIQSSNKFLYISV